MENLIIQTSSRTTSRLNDLASENQVLRRKVQQLERDKRELTSDKRKLDNTIKEQSKTIKELSSKVLKSLESQKIELNKDKYTFQQFFNIKCSKKAILKHLETFLESKPTWVNLDVQKLEQFSIWLRNQSGIKESSAANYIILLKNVINQGYQDNSNVSGALKAGRPAKEKKIWLKPNELRAFSQYVPQNEDEIYVHKMFLICSLTGCRVGDAPSLRAEHIDGYTLRYTPVKTRSTECYVQLSEKVKTVLVYLFQKEVTPTKRNENEILKIIFRKIGITRKMEIGTPNKPNIVRICDAVHYHTARHSFATIKFRYSNWTEREIATAIGHTDFRMTFANYVIDISPVSESEKTQNYDEIFN